MDGGDLWFATGRGGICILRAADRLNFPYRFDRLTHCSNIYPRHNLSSSSIRCLFEDSFGNKWVGNETNGVDVVCHTPPFFIIEQPFPQGQFSRPVQAVWSTAYDASGSLWIGGEDQVMRMGRDFPATFDLPTKKSGYNALVKTIMCDRNGKIWVGTSNSGVYLLNPASGVFSALKISDSDIRDFIEDADGSVLIATKSGVFRSSGYAEAVSDDKINGVLLWNRNVTSLFRDSAGVLWIGTLAQGVVGIRPDGEW